MSLKKDKINSKMDSINDLVESYDASEGKLHVQKLKELLKELRKSKVYTYSTLSSLLERHTILMNKHFFFLKLLLVKKT